MRASSANDQQSLPSRVRDAIYTATAATAAAFFVLLAGAFFAFIIVGGMFYRTSCPSDVSWKFNPIPFVYVVDTGETACATDTATGYYTGKVPVIGGTLRAIVKSVTGQAEGTTP